MAVSLPSRSTNTLRAPFTMISLTSGSVMRCAIGRRKGRTSSNATSEVSGGGVVEITGLHVEVARFQVAVGRGKRIRPVVCEDDGLCVLELGEDLRLKHVIELQAVGLRRAHGGAMRGRPGGEETDRKS